MGMQQLDGSSVVAGLVLSAFFIPLIWAVACKIADRSNEPRVMESRCQYCHGVIEWHGGWGVGNWICKCCGRKHN